MGKLIREAIEAAQDWLGDVSDEQIVMITNSFALQAIESGEEKKVPAILKGAIKVLNKIGSEDAKKVISNLRAELADWPWPRGRRRNPQKLVPLM